MRYLTVSKPIQPFDVDGKTPLMKLRPGVEVKGRELLSEFRADEKEPLLIDMADWLRMTMRLNPEYFRGSPVKLARFHAMVAQFHPDKRPSEGPWVVPVNDDLRIQVLAAAEKPGFVFQDYGINEDVVGACSQFLRDWEDAATEPPIAKSREPQPPAEDPAQAAE